MLLRLVFTPAAVAVGMWLGLPLRAANAPLGITIDSANPGTPIGPTFSGFSYEVSGVLPGATGTHYFRPDNTALVTIFRTLGIKSLRIGGNTSDRNAKSLPSPADLDSLFAFAKAADVKVIYCLRLHEGDPEADAATAKYLMDHYGAQIDSFSIGQEPSAYPVGKVDTRPQGERMGGAAEKFSYGRYHDEWLRFEAVIAAAVPDIRLCGPSVHNNGVWATRFIADFGTGHHVVLVTEHLYAGGAAGKLPSAEVGRDRMLSDDFTRTYEKLYHSFVPAAKAAGLPYRLEEVNSYFNGGAPGASNTYSAALWTLDFMYWWASHAAVGLNFHTGDKVAAGGSLQTGRYSAFTSVAGGGLVVQPVSYGLKAFDLGGHGRVVPVAVENGAQLNATAYATLADDRTVTVTIINKEHGANARVADVSLAVGTAWKKAEITYLRQAANDVSAKSEITIGDAPIEKDGTWAGHWQPLAAANAGGKVNVSIPAATAAVIRFDR